MGSIATLCSPSAAVPPVVVGSTAGSAPAALAARKAATTSGPRRLLGLLSRSPGVAWFSGPSGATVRCVSRTFSSYSPLRTGYPGLLAPVRPLFSAVLFAGHRSRPPRPVCVVPVLKAPFRWLFAAACRTVVRPCRCVERGSWAGASRRRRFSGRAFSGRTSVRRFLSGLGPLFSGFR